jgi:type II secretory ATPase GspE/PulE/Tfp pilus assembly ATPase PilB-like protein
VLKEVDFSTPDEPLQTNAEEEETLTQLEFIVANSREENKEALKELRGGSRKRNYAVRLLSMILSRAAQQEASDVHLEPGIDSTVIRLRVDGVLQDLMKVPQAQQALVVQRIKNLADMEAGPHRVPQEGRFLIIHKGRRLDIRVSTLPTPFGEKILIRILDPRFTLRTFEQLGMSRRHENALKRILNMPEGMLIVTGPTGAGKSTTLYSALNAIASPHRSIVAVEDPIEFMLEGITQVQLNPASGLDLAAMLPSILRQHPDVIMIGELLDEETTETALRAAQIGHLVLTTLHTYDSIDAITLLRSFKVPTNLISSIQGIVGQNLVRTLCTCRTELEATEHFRASLRKLGHSQPVDTMHQPAGCDSCAGTGYRGRIGVFELFLIEGAIRDALQQETPVDEIRRMLPGTGFRSMQQDALDKVVEGQSTLDEVMHAFPLVV